MHELLEKKRQQAQSFAQVQPAEKKKSVHALSPSMSEGLMTSEGAKIEAAGRASFEKSVKIELASILSRQKKAPPKKAFRKWGDKIKDDNQLDPPDDDGDKKGSSKV